MASSNSDEETGRHFDMLELGHELDQDEFDAPMINGGK